MYTYEANKEFIRKNLDLASLFEYLVKYGYMESSCKDRFLNDIFQGYKNSKSITYESCNEKFCDNFLIKYFDNDIHDNLIFKSLINAGQKDIVLVLFPDFIEKSREITSNRIDTVMIDAKKIIKYIEVNGLIIPPSDGNCLNTKTHNMQTRRDEKEIKRLLFTYYTNKTEHCMLKVMERDPEYKLINEQISFHERENTRIVDDLNHTISVIETSNDQDIRTSYGKTLKTLQVLRNENKKKLIDLYMRKGQKEENLLNDEIFVKNIFKSRVLMENFDYNTDPFIKALYETQQQDVLSYIFPEYYKRLTYKV